MSDITVKYMFGDTKRWVENEIHSTYEFQNGLIERHVDKCSELKWALQAFGILQGPIVWLHPFEPAKTAAQKLQNHWDKKFPDEYK